MSQSGEEDTELRDLLKQTLEENGVLCKLRAQLRSCVFLALDENNAREQKNPILNKKLNKHQLTSEGQLLFCLVREFLEYFDLDMTISVFEPESYCGTGYKYEGRSKLIEKLGLEFESDKDVPILLQLLQSIKNIPMNTSTQSREDTFDRSELEDVNCKNDELTKQNLLNATFNVSTPSIHSAKPAECVEKKDVDENTKNAQIPVPVEVILSPRSLDESDSKDSIKTEDTYGEQSSIAEDDRDLSIPITDCNATPPGMDQAAENIKSLLDESNVELESRETKSSPSLSDKLKLSPHKTEKLKSKTSFTSLTDLPPLHLNKSRDTRLLPSLYTKEFKEKTSLKEIDKLLDIDIDSLDNYEEDFMSGSELDLSQMQSKDLMSGDSSKFNSFNEGSVKSESNDLPSKISVKPSAEELENKLGISKKPESDTNSITEDLEFNSKIDDN